MMTSPISTTCFERDERGVSAFDLGNSLRISLNKASNVGFRIPSAYCFSSGVSPKAPAQFSVVPEASHFLREIAGVPRLEEQTIDTILDHPCNGADVRRDNRDAVAHGLGAHRWRSFKPYARDHQHTSRPVEFSEVLSSYGNDDLCIRRQIHIYEKIFVA